MHKYIYCSVKFDTEKSYYYRTDERGYHIGSKVIVLIENFPPATSEQVKNRPKEI